MTHQRKRKVFRCMIYRMSDAEKSTQIGDLMLEKQAAERNLAALVTKAHIMGNLLDSVGDTLKTHPETLVFGNESVDGRFPGLVHVAGVLPSHQDVSELVNAIRSVKISIMDATKQLKDLGF